MTSFNSMPAGVKAAMDAIVRNQAKLARYKAIMKRRRLTVAVAKCFQCGEKDAMTVRIAGPRDHVRLHCSKCKFQMME